jgi:hypothetical protein
MIIGTSERGFADSIADQTWLISDMLAEGNMHATLKARIRKSLYGIMLLGIIFSALGTGSIAVSK